MRRFVLGWKQLGLERSLGSRIVTYADDLVILCQYRSLESRMRKNDEKKKHFDTCNRSKNAADKHLTSAGKSFVSQ